MKFFVKRANSQILVDGVVYKKGNNQRLLKMLLAEQKNFCAYTEKYILGLDSCEVEHFDSSKKFKDDYYNYYAVVRSANLYKKDEVYKVSAFFRTLFFQLADGFEKRIRFVGGEYEELDPADIEAREFIDFIGLNHHVLTGDRIRSIRRLRGIFEDAAFGQQDIIGYFKRHPEELSFITALESEFEVDLSQLLP